MTTDKTDEDEFYPYVYELTAAVATMGARLEARQMTPTTWVLWAVKPEATRYGGGRA